jgi:site-specific DNA-cytosine methylase
MNKIEHASIVPLIGGLSIAMENVFESKSKYVLSYSAFEANDSQYLNYRPQPYYLIDKGQFPALENRSVDVVGAVCPCAGLSSLSPSAGSKNKMNDWMIESAEYVLKNIKPEVFWGENAPRLSSKMGEPIVEKLRKIASKNGYVFSLYKTKSILHGLGQVRDRTFYFFWKGNSIPILPYFRRKHERIEDTITNAYVSKSDSMNALANEKLPTDNPFYQYILEELCDGMNHEEFQKSIERSSNPLDFLEAKGIKYCDVAKWMKDHGYENEAGKCFRMFKKLESGGNIMRKTTEVPKDYIGAFVGHFPTCLTHPTENRYLTIRECLSIMKMPADFELIGGRKNLNMICQNVPVTTAQDMASAVRMYLEGKLDSVQSNFLIQDNKKQNYDYEKEVVSLEGFFC